MLYFTYGYECIMLASMPDYILPPDEQDRRLNKEGGDSLFQRVRLLTAQQRTLLDLILSGTDPTEACAKAGYKSRGGLATLAKKVPDILDRCKLSEDVLIEQHLKPLLVAKETKFFQCRVEGSTMYLGSDGVEELKDTTELIIEEREVAALGIRRDALDMAFKLHGSYARPDAGDDPLHAGGINVQIVMVGA